jgi:hypothetical protein
LLLSLGGFMVVLVGLGQKGTAYEYTPSTDSHEYSSATPEDYTATHSEDATASKEASESNGQCSCGVHAYTWAKEDNAVAEAHADASYGKYWDWNGPPGTAPGGTLYWYQDGQGSEWAIGANWPENGGAFNVADCETTTFSHSPSSNRYSWANSHGHVTDNGNPSGGSTYGGSPWPYYHDPYDRDGSGWYDYRITWATDPNDPAESVASGTAHISFSGGAMCDTYSGATAFPPGSNAEAFAETYGSALVRLTASFTPNP